MPTYFFFKIQAAVSLLSTKAEYIALESITQEILFQQQILNKVLGEKYDKISIIHEDNLGAIYLTENPQMSQRTKNVDMRHHFIRNLVKKKTIEIQSVKSENKNADVLTKNVKEETFAKHAKTIKNGKVRYNTKEKGKVNYGNDETKEDQ